jgi:transglutaminase-like putative cysteine protease
MTLSYLGWIPDGDAGTFATLRRMARVANQAQVDPLTVSTAHTIVLPCTPRNTVCYAQRIRAWLAARFQFVPDALDVDTAREPHYLLEQLNRQGVMTGDCDDAAVIAAALGKAIGLPARFQVLRFASQDNAFAHVYAELDTGQGWLDMDVTKPRGPVESPTATVPFDV